MKNLPAHRAIPSFRGFAERLFGTGETAEPVPTWRMAPEGELASLPLEEKRAYIAALLPLVGNGRNLRRTNLRRLYQLFAFMEMPTADRFELLRALDNAPQAASQNHHIPSHRRVRRSLAEEAEFFASNLSSRAAFDYVALLRVRLNANSRKSRKLTRILGRFTDLENRAATVLGKRGHIVLPDDRRLEIFKKSLAAIGVPSAVLFPLGTVGLSAEGITTGLAVLGGGFVLPSAVAMITGLGAAVAIGITSKKLLDMLMPTADADRASIDVQQLGNGIVEIELLLNEVAGHKIDPLQRELARERITNILRGIAPLSKMQRRRIQFALDHARILGERYLASLEHDGAALQRQHHVLAQELTSLLHLDRQALGKAG